MSTVWVMQNPRQGLTWRPDPELEEVIRQFAKSTHRNISQAITTLVTAALSGDVSYGPAPAIEAHLQRILDTRHNQLINERHTAENHATGGTDPQ